MSTYPAITAAVADQHRRDIIAQADAYRLARAARRGRSGRPALTGQRLVTATVAACTAAGMFVLSPAAAHAASQRWASPGASQRWSAPAASQRWASPAATARVSAHHFAAPTVTVHFRHVYAGHHYVHSW